MDNMQGFTGISWCSLFSPSSCLRGVRGSAGSLTRLEWPLLVSGIFSGGRKGLSSDAEAVQCCHP